MEDFSEAAHRIRKINVMERLQSELRRSMQEQRVELLNSETISEAIRQQLIQDSQWEKRIRDALEHLHQECGA